MCDHLEMCESCEDELSETWLFRERSELYRKKYNAAKKNNRDLEKAHLELKARCKQLENAKKTAALDVQVELLSSQLDKLRALNHHLTTKCAVEQRDAEKLHEAYQKVVHECGRQHARVQTFSLIFQILYENKETKPAVQKALTALRIDAKKFLEGI